MNSGDVMNYQINRTPDGTKTYPLHKHNDYEIMFYLQGSGCLRTREADYRFSPGSIIVVPPGTEHGSASENGFQNISVGGDFENMFCFESAAVLSDNAENEGRMLASMIYNNRFGDGGFVSKLCSAYAYFILRNVSVEKNVAAAVNKIVSEISDRCFDSGINLRRLLLKSGYAEDYIRSRFKKITGKTPNSFLTDFRINRAAFLIDVYAQTLSLQQISEQCGYTDYVYFSRKFKAVKGVSPKEYRDALRKKTK